MRSLALLLLLPAVLAVDIFAIQGDKFQSLYIGQSVTVTGVVTAKNGTGGFWLASSPPPLIPTDDAIYVDSTGTSVLASVESGDIVTLDGTVAEWRRKRDDKDSLPRTQLVSPSNVTKISSGNVVEPIVIGANGLHPPTNEFTSLDAGGILNVPNNVAKVTTANPTRDPLKYGLDFWESLSGKLVKITSPTAVSYPDKFHSFWVRGDWPVTGLNERGGLTITSGPDGLPDLNPETILIGDPLDGSVNPDVWMGTNVTEITGVLTYDYGFYRLLPLTAPTVIAHNETLQGPTTLTITATNANCTLTFGDYNVENMFWGSDHLPSAASQIGDYLKSPDLVFLQEIQDDSGRNKTGTVTSDRTLQTFVDAITSHSGVRYNYTYIAPLDGQDGGEEGGNIRTAFLYRPERLRLVEPKHGGALNKTEVVNHNGTPGLTFNPGRIDPANPIWGATRKPLVALFESISSGEQIFAINVHMTSKRGGSSLHGDLRPPVNAGVTKRAGQVQLLADFVGSILSVNADANIVTMGDFNEFVQTNSVYSSLTRHLKSIDDAAGIPPVERYTYVYDMNAQQIDHAFLSAKLQPGAEVEHLHINNWLKNSTRTSDHDPSVARVKICSL